MKKLSVKKSKIHGNGLFANEPIKKGDTIGVAHQILNTSNHKVFIPTAIVGSNYNHSKNNPNAENVNDGNKRYLVALKDIKPGTEITANYFNTPDMEQPKKEWEDKLGNGGEPTDCPEGYYYDPVKGCVPGDEHHKWLREWYANRQMNTPEGQKILKKVQPEILERSTEFPPYVMTEELPKNTPAAYDTENNVVLLNKFLPEKMLEESKTHENAHYLTSGDKFQNLFDKEIGYVINQNVIDGPKKIKTGNEEWDKNLKENFDYAVSPEEIYSKIMTLRKDAGFDSAKTITMQDLNDYFIKMKDAGTPLNPDIEELKAVTKDKQSIVNLLNDLVYQAPTNQDIQITKRGGSIKKFNPGGIVNDLPQNVGISYLPKDDRSFYDPLSDTINLNPNAADAELNHEMVHAWQNRTGRLRTNPNLPQQRPPIVASDEQAASYYTRKGDDVDYYLNNLPTLYPDLTGGNIWTEDLNRFIPEQVKYDKAIDPLMYLDPNTMEGEAEMFSQVYGPPPGIGFRQKGGSIDAAFQKKLQEVAKRLKVKPSDLLGIMKHESGLKANAVNPYTGATGLIQFMPATAKRMGTSVEALKNMSALEQLDYVEKFYKPVAGKAKNIGDLYMFTFLPAAVGKPDDFVLGARGSNDKLFGINKNALYTQNKGFDKDNKGYYTVGDVKARIGKFSGSKIKINEDKPEQTGVPIEEYSKVTYNPVEEQQPKKPQYSLEQAMFEMGALDQPINNNSKAAQALQYLAPKRFSPGDVQTYLNNEEIKQYVKGGYIVEELDEFDKGGEKDKWGRSKGSKWYGFDPDTKEWTSGLPDWKKEEQKLKFKIPIVTPFDLDRNIGINSLNIKQPEIPWDFRLLENPEWVKQKEEVAINAEILKNGMIDATRLTRQGGLEKNKEDFIRNQVREQLNLPTTVKYQQDKKKVAENKLEKIDVAKVNKTPIDLKQFTDPKNNVDFVKTQEQEGWETMNSLLNEMDNDADVYYNKVKKVNSKERGDKSNRDLLREDLLDAINSGEDINKLLTNIRDKSGEWQYNELAKKEEDTPLIDPFSFTPLGLFSKSTKLGQFERDLVADPLNVMEELIWDQDYMVNRNEILRDPSHPLYDYYMKRTGMDKSPLSQGLQYINPFSSAAESSVAIGKGDYGDAALQFGEGLLKTAGIAAAGELAPFLGQYTIPGVSGVLPGMTYAQGLNILGAGMGVSNIPKTFRSIKTAIEKGDKESIREAVNQTATNALDFIGITELKNIWNVPEKSIFYLAEDLTDAKNFAKEIKDLKKSGVVDDFLYQDRLDMWNDAMRQTQAKYADQGFYMKPDEVLNNPDAVQYLKSTFEEMKAESIAYLESDEGRASIQKMLDEFPRTKRGEEILGQYINKYGEVITSNTDPERLTRFLNEANKNPKKFTKQALEAIQPKLEEFYKEFQYWEKENQRLLDEFRDISKTGDQDAADQIGRQSMVAEGNYNDLKAQIQKLEELEKALSVENPNLESIFNSGNFNGAFLIEDYQQPIRATGAYKKFSNDPKYIPVDRVAKEFTVDDYINRLRDQKYYSEQKILTDAKIYEGYKKNIKDLQDLLAQTDAASADYTAIEAQIADLRNLLSKDLLGDGNAGNTWFNAFHDISKNETLIGRSFVPATETTKPVTIAHEMAHGIPRSWRGFNREAPWYDVFRGYGSQGSKRMGLHPVDEVLSEIDLFDAPPDFVQYRNMKPWYKGDGVNPFPSTVEEIEVGQGMPLAEYKTAAGQLDVSDAIDIGNHRWTEAKDYFIRGSLGNEKVTFLAEVKQAMLDAGYGKRGNFTMKDLESFWKEYVQKSKQSSYGWDLRLLEIARPTPRTKKYILKGLNMPAYESGGQVDHELGDEVDLTPEQVAELERQGYTLEKL